MAVVVVGSLNRDVVLEVSELPRTGETVASLGLGESHGGKGMNQAIASALAGARVRLVGCVGRDGAGEALVRFAAERGVDVSGVRVADGPTGVAHILRSAAGENVIVITAGANALVGEQVVAAGLAGLAAGDVLVVQGEIPEAATAAAVRGAADVGARVVVNLAPLVRLPPDVLTVADPLVVNEVEAAGLLGVSEATLDAEAAVTELASLARSAVITLGGEGAITCAGGVVGRTPAQATRVVDTTGAGDAFVGVLAARLAQGRSLADATRSATVAGTLSVSSAGGADSYTSAFGGV